MSGKSVMERSETQRQAKSSREEKESRGSKLMMARRKEEERKLDHEGREGEKSRQKGGHSRGKNMRGQCKEEGSKRRLDEGGYLWRERRTEFD
jgi:hypothetical protein